MEATKKYLNGSQGTGNWPQWVVLMGGLAAFAMPFGLASCQLEANGRSYQYILRFSR